MQHLPLGSPATEGLQDLIDAILPYEDARLLPEARGAEAEDARASGPEEA